MDSGAHTSTPLTPLHAQLNIQGLCYQDSVVLTGPAFMRATEPSVTTAPVSCSGESVSPRIRYPVPAAKQGVRKVRLERAVRLPLAALLKKTP